LLILPACGGDNHSETTPDNAELPKVFEKDIQDVLDYGRYIGHPEVKERQTLIFPLTAGDRVEGEVIITGGKSNQLIASVRDTFGNTVSQSATQEINVTYPSLESGAFIQTHLKSTQTYPWRFAFIAAATGEYTLEVNTNWYPVLDMNAHVRVTVYQK
jgi:LytS/YehU family sensor histidine kinase